MSRDTNGIYNFLTRVPLYTFDELLSRVNEYAMVEDDELVVIGSTEEKRGIVKNLLDPKGRGRRTSVK